MMRVIVGACEKPVAVCMIPKELAVNCPICGAANQALPIAEKCWVCLSDIPAAFAPNGQRTAPPYEEPREPPPVLEVPRPLPRTVSLVEACLCATCLAYGQR
jgi:hypothetical protein